jgi:hypothetical protein
MVNAVCRVWRFVRGAPLGRWGYLGVLTAIFTVPLIAAANFMATGHFSAIFIGLMFCPMARRRPAIAVSRSRS